MVEPKLPDRVGRIPYKTYLSLLIVEWDALRAEAIRRHITVREVIEGALSQYCASLPKHTPMLRQLDRLPEDKGD